MSADRPKRCGVAGSPIAHSLSPTLHLAAYAELGLDWSYGAHDVIEDSLGGFLDAMSEEWRGLSLTMPLKRRVIELSDQVEPLARTLNSANTLVIENGRRHVFNTDVVGFTRAFAEAGIGELASVLLVGAGATAASALAAARELGATEVVIAVRSAARAAPLASLASDLGLRARVAGLDTISGIDVAAAISTIPASAQGAVADFVADAAPVVFDVIYHPRETALTTAGRARGRVVIGGFSLLLHQAARQVELMTGAREAPLEAMRAAGLKALNR